MRALVGGWRKVWNQGDFPFYFVQLANFQKPNRIPPAATAGPKSAWRSSRACRSPIRGMAVTIDIGDAATRTTSIPRTSSTWASGLAPWALPNDYGKTDLVCQRAAVQGDEGRGRARFASRFDLVGGGLMVGKKEGRNPTVEDQGGKLQRLRHRGRRQEMALGRRGD